MISVENIHVGKIRTSLVLNNKTRIIQTSSRISAFDFVFPFQIPAKAEVLQALSVWFFNNTKHIVENHLLGCLDNHHLLVKEASVFPVEIVIRRYLSGSLWRLYKTHGSAGVLKEYGVELSEGLTKNTRFPYPILTPTIKAEMGHDTAITQSQAAHIVGTANWHRISEIAEKLFLFGEEQAQERRLILVDTKYEMALYENRIILVDEIHTPDSSRYWFLDEIDFENPKQLSKEFFREELIKILGEPENIMANPVYHQHLQDPATQHFLIEQVSKKYQQLAQLFLGSFTPTEITTHNMIAWPMPPNYISNIFKNATLPYQVLVVGNGGRDYTIAATLARAPEVNRVFCAAGNRQWNLFSEYENCLSTNVEDIAHFAKETNVGLVIAGPETPISQGLAQACEALNIPVLAPSLNCASLEASKIICKQIIESAGIKTASSKIFTWTQLKAILLELIQMNNHPEISLPFVIKYDSLASGKGVFVIKSIEQVAEALANITQNIPEWNTIASQIKADTYSKQVGEASFLIEELICGDEISVIALCNGSEFRLLPIARDYKCRNNGQTGSNTGGMGAVAPVALEPYILAQVKVTFEKTLKELINRSTPYYGFLFAGFMVDAQKNAWLLEYNCRLGDPETQVILPSLSRDFYIELYRTAKKERLLFPEKSGSFFASDEKMRVFVVAIQPEYPDIQTQRRQVLTPQRWIQTEGTQIQMIPSAIEKNRMTSGGRAFGLLGEGKNVQEIRNLIYRNLDLCSLRDTNAQLTKLHYRTDIAQEFET